MPETAATATLYANARLFDSRDGRDEAGGLLVRNGLITDLGPHLDSRPPPRDARVIDCGGHVLAPGLIDMRVFTGEPGFEHRETLATISQSAAAGGISTLICMPNTDPVIDDVALVDYIARRARANARVNVHPMAALTKGLLGEEMTEIGMLAEAGAIAFTDGLAPVTNARLLRQIMTYATMFGALIVQHAEDPDLARGGVMNEGATATRLGLPGIPAAAETIIIERDLQLVELTGCRYHAAQISCRAALAAMQNAKSRGLPVTCGVSINHLVLNENDVGPYRTFFKMTPPLRSEDDRRAMVDGLGDGVIDVIVSSHDPQDPDTKRRPFAEAAFGAAGVETLLPAALSLVHGGEVSLARVLRALTATPAAILGLDSGRLAPGAPADLVLIDIDTPWTLDIDDLKSKSRNTPFEGRHFQGRALRTVVAGDSVFVREG
ncbi:MAG TPA: dihydroorotase [Rhodobacteraceae bacterium]|nr:dihydroorotase [Paracoccaceae bacterium]